ncbi:MAG: hypothetical protein JXQ80_05905 [Bacteroidales bacterium]|nr:hypothetical protein [Bacteroidales bacterium]
MISLPPSKKSASSLRINHFLFALAIVTGPVSAQHLTAFHDNQERFCIFDRGKIIQAEYLPVSQFSIGGNCIVYTDNRNRLKMYHNGRITELELNRPDKLVALDHLAVYSIGGVVKIIDNGKTVTISTNAVDYQSEDSLVTFYDVSRELLAVYYKRRIHMLEDGLAGRPDNLFKTADNLVAYVSSRTQELKVFYRGQNLPIESFQSGGDFKAGRDIVAYINHSDMQFRVFSQGKVYEVEAFAPTSWQVGNGIAAYMDNNGYFRVFSRGIAEDISSLEPDFYRVVDNMIIYGEKGYFKVWYNNRIYTLESFIPSDWEASWNTVVYRDLNKNIKVFSKGESRVLTYDLAEGISLNRDIILINKGLNNHNIYYEGEKY